MQDQIEISDQNEFQARHIGPNTSHVQDMLSFLKLKSLEDLTENAVPAIIRNQKPLDLQEGLSELSFLRRSITSL